MYHVDLRSGVHAARAFNLEAAELEARFLTPTRGGTPYMYEDREWDPTDTRLTVVEAERLRPDQIGMGRGWATVEKNGADVTAELLRSGPARCSQARPAMLDQLKERLLGRLSAGPVRLGEIVSLAAELAPGQRVSEHLALAELGIWELLHQQRAELRADGSVVPPAIWAQQLLTGSSWLEPERRVSLARAS